MAKILSFEKHKIRQRIKQLQLDLEQYNRPSKPPFAWFDHYTVVGIQKEIDELNQKLRSIPDDVSSHKTKDS